MNCHAHREAIGDLARGVAMPGAIFSALQTHIDRCPACAAELRRQEQLSAGLRELAAEAESWFAPVRLEQRLNAALDSAADVHPASVRSGRGSYRWWALTAAALVVVVSWLAVRTQQTVRPRDQTVRQDAPVVVPAAPSAVAAPAAQARLEGTSRQRDPQPTARAVRSRPGGRRAQSVRTVEFIAIPGAAGLPALESATIVRTELPISALPTYGVNIAPDARRSAVEADLLVGQDGQARAIRLVTAEQEASDSRSRQ